MDTRRLPPAVAVLAAVVLLWIPAGCSADDDRPPVAGGHTSATPGPHPTADPSAVPSAGTISPSTEASGSPPPASPTVGDRGGERLAMVEAQIAGRGVSEPRVLEAMRTVRRHEFVPAEQADRAYQDRPLPIGEGQTISQPYMVALMTELLDVQAGDVVLEIGTGSGYQAAVLAELTDRVYTIEILPELARRAGRTLERSGYGAVRRKTADGYFGWPEHGPYDGIVVTAAPDHIPSPLVEQLKEGGRMVIPVGPPGSYQTLWRLTKQQGRVVSENITDVAFVPLVRKG